MTRKQFIYLGLGAVILFALVVRLIFQTKNKVESHEAEKEWYINSLDYNFAAEIDTIAVERADGLGPGMVVCKLTRGNFNYRTEDSLKREIKYHKKLRFNEMRERGYIRFLMPGANRFMQGDCLVVQSDSNKFEIFRQHKRFYKADLSNIIQSRGSID
jgi:hypothetical protein